MRRRFTRPRRDFFASASKPFTAGETPPMRVRATYPYIAIDLATFPDVDSRQSYGFLGQPGRYQVTLTRPDLFDGYLIEQIGLLIGNHGVKVEVGQSSTPIPIHFAFPVGMSIAEMPSLGVNTWLRDVFDVPDLGSVDDEIANSTNIVEEIGVTQPLSLLHGAARRLFAASPRALYGDRSRAFPELCDLHQLPVLCRCLRGACESPTRGRRSRLYEFRRARQSRHA